MFDGKDRHLHIIASRAAKNYSDCFHGGFVGIDVSNNVATKYVQQLATFTVLTGQHINQRKPSMDFVIAYGIYSFPSLIFENGTLDVF